MVGCSVQVVLENVLENSSYNSQIRQLRILAEAALTQYDIGSAHLTFMAHGVNTIFRVTSTPRPGLPLEEVSEKHEEARLALRLLDQRTVSRVSLNSELEWLASLNQDAGLLVPESIRSRDGDMLATVKIEDVEHECFCILSHWVPGRFMDSGLSPTLFERVGTFMARLHENAKSFTPSENFERHHWNWKDILGDQTVLDPEFAATECDGLISGREYRIFSEVAERIYAELQRIPITSEYYGLIHSNFQRSNCLFYRGNVGAIGFEKCHWNHYLFDISVSLSAIAGRADEELLKKAFFHGYERIRALPPRYEECIHMFKSLRIIEHVNFLFNSQDPTTRAQSPLYLSYAVECLE